MIGPTYHLGICPVLQEMDVPAHRCPGHYRDEPTLRDLTEIHAEKLFNFEEEQAKWAEYLKAHPRNIQVPLKRVYYPLYDYIYRYGRVEAERRHEAFGNTHVGDMCLTNMEIDASQHGLPSDNKYIVPFVRVHAQFDDEKCKGDLLRGLARNMQFTWTKGNKPRYQAHVVPNALIQINSVVGVRESFVLSCSFVNGFEQVLNALKCEGHVRVELHGIQIRHAF